MNDSTNQILQHLRKYGERLDKDIAFATGIPLIQVKLILEKLTNQGAIISCSTIRFDKGKKIEGMLCRIAGYVHPLAPNLKPQSQR